MNEIMANEPVKRKMPLLFLGHGNPMNAITENEFVEGFRNISKKITKPKAILCVSAHWETEGTFITAMKQPRTIHDFGGFPDELYEVEYPAPGSPDLAAEISEKISKVKIELDKKWGLDHGCWSVIKHLYPKADIPVLQLSLDYRQSPQFHYELSKELSWLRESGVLITGSGNIVHNLGMAAWNKMNEEYAFDWAKETDEKVKECIVNNDHELLIKFQQLGKSFDFSIPTPEHYLPMLYVLALKEKDENVNFFNEKIIAGSLSMTSFLVS